MSEARRIALITIAHGRHRHLSAQLDQVQRGTRRPDQHVVVSMGDDAITSLVAGAPRTRVVSMDADPGALPLAAARNAGAAAALADGADTLVFLDVDCLPGPRLLQRYADVTSLTTPGVPVIRSGPVHYLPALTAGHATYEDRDLAESAPHPARPAPVGDLLVDEPRLELFWSLSFAITSTDWRRLGGFCEDYVGYGAEDTDLARVLAAEGGRLTWVGGATAYHQHHPTHSPPLQHLSSIVRNASVFRRRWGDHPMLGWLHEFEARGLVRLDTDTGEWITCERSPACRPSRSI